VRHLPVFFFGDVERADCLPGNHKAVPLSPTHRTLVKKNGAECGDFGLKTIPIMYLTIAIMLLAICGVLERCTALAAQALDALVAAYPEAVASHDGERIIWRDGTIMAATDGIADKSFKELLSNASILDQFRLPYPRGRLTSPPRLNADPGRFRNEAFFKKMYGDCRKGEVQARMVSITWLPKSWGKSVQVTGVNGVAQRLKRVSEEIETLPTEIRKAAHPIAGVLACRPVADTGQMSMHGYGAAIDLNLAVSDYWLWQKKTDPIPYRNRMPPEIVDIFERYGFIWGGKWYHYDTMHFEYRPELLGMSGKLFRSGT
jgi:D-alanyl-D-alanine carboxypeptidase